MIIENIQLAVSSLLSNKMRALLTMLGIIIGIMSIITIVVIGDAMTATVSDNLATMGANNVFAHIQERTEETGFGPIPNTRTSSTGKVPESADLITDEMLDGLKTQLGDIVEGVSMSVGLGSAKVQEGDLYANVYIMGVSPDYFTAQNYTLLSGRQFTEEDMDEATMSAVVSNKLVNNMFPGGTDPIGHQIKVYMANQIKIYTIIGVYEYVSMGQFAGTQSDRDIQTDLILPYRTATIDILEKNHNYITIITKTGTDVERATERIAEYFDAIYDNNETWHVNVINMTSMLDTLSEVMGTISSAIALIAGISLVVGGIGVMNIMLVSVTERTREIGTRKALGAKNFHIQVQFVMEALLIALVGGVIGMALGIAFGYIVTDFMDARMVVSPFVVIGSMLFSMLIGIFFGLYPANKAAKLDPIEALRYE